MSAATVAPHSGTSKLEYKPREPSAFQHPITSDEDREILDERLKDLGYL